jgi:DNA modification methylase
VSGALVYQDAYGALWHGDSREVLPTLPAESVGLIVTSPPYNVGWDYGDGGAGDSLPLPDYLDGLLTPVLAECCRVLQDGGVLALNLPTSIRVYDCGQDGQPQRPQAHQRGKGRSHKPDRRAA